MPRRTREPSELLIGPEAAGPTFYLLDAATDLEIRMLRRWLASELGFEPQTIRIDSSRRGRGGDAARRRGVAIVPTASAGAGRFSGGMRGGRNGGVYETPDGGRTPRDGAGEDGGCDAPGWSSP